MKAANAHATEDRNGALSLADTLVREMEEAALRYGHLREQLNSTLLAERRRRRSAWMQSRRDGGAPPPDADTTDP